MFEKVSTVNCYHVIEKNFRFPRVLREWMVNFTPSSTPTNRLWWPAPQFWEDHRRISSQEGTSAWPPCRRARRRCWCIARWRIFITSRPARSCGRRCRRRRSRRTSGRPWSERYRHSAPKSSTTCITWLVINFAFLQFKVLPFNDFYLHSLSSTVANVVKYSDHQTEFKVI